MTHQNIILTGFMGTGKTTVGRLLAKKLTYRFIDTDDTIVSKTGKTVAQIFETLGENAFRRMESDLALELSTLHEQVIATGGGMLMNSDNVTAFSGSGIIFSLMADPETIIHRVSHDGGALRPLLDVPDPKKKIEELLTQRGPIYERFIQIDTTEKSPESICEEIAQKYQNITS